MTKLRLCGFIILAFAIWLVLPQRTGAQTASTAALTGHVTSQEESAMEGVLVSAKRAGSKITLTVVSDEHGQYSFPGTGSSRDSIPSVFVPSGTIWKVPLRWKSVRAVPRWI